jgi:hypothetical protein
MQRRFLLVALAVSAMSAGAANAAPVIADASIGPTGWTSTDHLSASWLVHNATPYLSAVEIEINSAHDGSADGTWSTIHKTAPIATASGTAPSIPIGLLEGRRAVRMVAWDGSGRTERYLGTLLLDQTPPNVLGAEVLTARPGETTYAWRQDNGGLSPTRMTGAVRIEVPSMGAGTGPWVTQPVALFDGPMQVTVSGAGLQDGVHNVFLDATDEAGNSGTTALPPLVVDHGPPVVSAIKVLRAPTAAAPSVQIAYTAVDPISGVPIGTAARVVDVDRQSVITRATGGPGTQAIWADLPAEGTYRLAVEVVDAVGNVGQSAPITVSTEQLPWIGAASPVDPAEAELRSAHLSVDMPGAVRTESGTTVQLARTITIGRRIRITGSLSASRGGPLAGAEIEVRDAGNRTLGRVLTNAQGSFALWVRPVRGGPLHVGVPLGDELLPGHPRSTLRIRMIPRVTLATSAHSARAGGRPVTFTGQILPSPGSLGIGAKNVVLEWRDPFRSEWRPMINSTVGANGSVQLRWAFGAGGFTVPVRLRLPPEAGWPTAGGLSHATSIVVK